MCDCYKELLRDTALAELNELSPSSRSTFELNVNYYPDAADAVTGVNPRSRMKEILDFCKDYAADFERTRRAFCSTAQPDSGKTHLSLAIASGGHWSERVTELYTVRRRIFMSRLEKEHFSSGRDNEYEGSEQAILECDLLVIDDLGAEFSTQFTVAELYNIINTRIMSRLPVIISTISLQTDSSRNIRRDNFKNNRQLYLTPHFCGKDIRQIKTMEQE